MRRLTLAVGTLAVAWSLVGCAAVEAIETREPRDLVACHDAMESDFHRALDAGTQEEARKILVQPDECGGATDDEIREITKVIVRQAVEDGLQSDMDSIFTDGGTEGGY